MLSPTYIYQLPSSAQEIKRPTQEVLSYVGDESYVGDTKLLWQILSPMQDLLSPTQEKIGNNNPICALPSPAERLGCRRGFCSGTCIFLTCDAQIFQNISPDQATLTSKERATSRDSNHTVTNFTLNFKLYGQAHLEGDQWILWIAFTKTF